MPTISGPNEPRQTVSAFTQTASKTVANTTTETSVFSTGIGSRVIPANSLVAGQRVALLGGGVYSTTVLAPGMTVKVKIGGTVVAQTTVASLLGGMANAAFDFSCRMVIRSIGPSGSIVPVGGLNFASSGGGRIFGDLVNGGSPVTIDTTVDQTVDVTVSWAVASASNTVTVTSATLSL